MNLGVKLHCVVTALAIMRNELDNPGQSVKLAASAEALLRRAHWLSFRDYMVNTRVLSISIIIPVHQGGDEFRRCLSSVTELDPAPLEVIVIADGNIGEDVQLAREFSIRLVQLPVRRGPACARNLGAKNAEGELSFFLDSDVVVPRDVVGVVQSAFAADPGLAAVFGSYDDEPAASSFLSQYRNLFHHYVHQSANPEASTFWAGCGAIRRELFLKLGGFDEDYGVPAIEDIELGRRLKLAGCRIKLLKTMQVKHLKYWGLWSLVKSDLFQRAIPWSRLILRSHWMINDLYLNLSSRLSVLLVFAMSGCLILAPAQLRLAGMAAMLAVVFLWLNLSLIGFFLKNRGVWFTVRAIPWL